MEAIADPKEIVEEFLKWWEMDVELNIFGENSCEPHHLRAAKPWPWTLWFSAKVKKSANAKT